MIDISYPRYSAPTEIVTDLKQEQSTSSFGNDYGRTFTPPKTKEEKADKKSADGDSNIANKNTSEFSYSPEKENVVDTLGSEQSEKIIPFDYEYMRGQYSSPYIKHNTELMIENMTRLFKLWEQQGTKDSHSEISQIKTLLDEYSIYLKQREDTNVLLGTLGLLFDKNNWEKMSEKGLSVIVDELTRFNSGNVSWDSLTKFSQELWKENLI